jgi:MFS family permease
MPVPTPGPERGPASILPGATMALVLLIAINFFNYVDRQVLPAVESKIELTFFSGPEQPRDTDTSKILDRSVRASVEASMGSLYFAFMAAYMLFAPLFGWLAEKMSRWLLIGIGVMVWSLACGASGLATSFGMLFLTRCLVGIGEAAYGPAAPALIADMYPQEKRGRMLSLFYVAIPVGSAFGYILGGSMYGLTGDWRWAFYVVVPPGIVLAVLCLWMREPRRGQADPAAPTRKARWSDYWIILKTPSYLLNTLGMTAMTFAMGGLAYWMPRYASEERDAGTLEHVNLVFGIIVVVSGLGATLLGGWAGDKLRPRFPGAYFLVSSLAMWAGFPLVVAALYLPFPAAWFLIFLACFSLFFNTGPTNTIIANVTHPTMRASAFALNILIIHALGDAVSPTILGWLNGYFGTMQVGFLAISGMFFLAGLAWFVGTRYLERDTELAATKG